MGARLLGVLLGVGTAVVVLLADAPPAYAHSGATPGVVSVAQTLGRHELTVTMYPPALGTGPMTVRITTQGRGLDSPVLLQAVPGSGPGAGEANDRTVVSPGPGPSTSATLRIDRPGAWEVVLVAPPDIARIPLSVPALPPTPLWAWVVRVGLVATVVGLIGATALWRRLPRRALGLGAGALVGVTMVATAGLLSTTVAAPAPSPSGGAAVAVSGMQMPGMDMASTGMPATGTAPSAAGRTDAGAVVMTSTPRPAADDLVELTLGLTDGSTGAPVDDLVVHDDALVHLAVIGPGNRLWHVHPIRVAPGLFTVRLPLDQPGRYGVFAETVRAGGGHQVSRSAFTWDAAPTPAAPDPPVPGAGPRQVAGMHVDVHTGRAVAGRDTRVELVFTQDGRPVRDLQAWLGMAAHLMVLGPATTATSPDPTDPATSFAHIHDMDPPTPSGYGPTIAFTYAFPAAGRYQLWAQVQRDWQLVTVPVTVDVAPVSSGT